MIIDFFFLPLLVIQQEQIILRLREEEREKEKEKDNLSKFFPWSLSMLVFVL